MCCNTTFKTVSAIKIDLDDDFLGSNVVDLDVDAVDMWTLTMCGRNFEDIDVIVHRPADGDFYYYVATIPVASVPDLSLFGLPNLKKLGEQPTFISRQLSTVDIHRNECDKVEELVNIISVQQTL